jgi:hypothetical protein
VNRDNALESQQGALGPWWWDSPREMEFILRLRIFPYSESSPHPLNIAKNIHGSWPSTETGEINL